MAPLRVIPLYILRPWRNPFYPKPFLYAFLPFFLMFLSPLQTNCLVIIIISLDGVGCFQCPRWKLFSHAEVRSSSPLSTPKVFGKVCSITLLCFCTLDILDKVLVIKKERDRKLLDSGVFWMLRETTQTWSYICSPWCYMIFCVAAALHLKSHTFSGGVMTGLHDETLTNILYNNVFNLFFKNCLMF